MELIKKFIDTDDLSWYRFSDREAFSPTSQRGFAGHREVVNGQEVWYAFFTPPEDRFNQIVQDAYQTYLLETAIRNNE
jgi:hypothetical protein